MPYETTECDNNVILAAAAFKTLLEQLLDPGLSDLGPRTTEPSNPTTGQFWLRTDLGRVHLRLGATTLALSVGNPEETGGTFISGPSISGDRGDTLTATDAPFSGTDTRTGEWYLDGVATGNTTTTFIDSDTNKSVEYRNSLATAGTITSAYRGVPTATPLYSNDFEAVASGTPLRVVPGWSFEGDGAHQDLQKVIGGAIQKTGTFPYEGYEGCAYDTGASSFIAEVECNFAGDTNGVAQRLIFRLGDAYFVAVRPNAGISANDQYVAWPSSGVAASTYKLQLYQDNVGKRLHAYLDGVELNFGTPGLGADLAGLTLSGKFRADMNIDLFQPLNADQIEAITFRDASKIQAMSVRVENRGGLGQYRLVVAGINAASTSSEYRVERESGEMVASWTSTTQTGGTWSATFNIPDYANQGERLVVKARNVGGTVSVAELRAGNAVPVVSEQKMRVSMNASVLAIYDGNSPLRDLGRSAQVALQPIGVSGSVRSIVGGPGSEPGRWSDWGNEYNPALTYPHSDDPGGNGGQGNQAGARCMFEGIAYRVADSHIMNGSIPINTPPNHAQPLGGPWTPIDSGLALHSLIYNSEGLIYRHPPCGQREVQFEIGWTHPQAKFPFTIAGSSAPGALLEFHLQPNMTLTTPVDANGNFVLTVTGDTDDIANYIIVKRTGPVVPALRLIPSFETSAGSNLASDVYVADMAAFYDAPRNMSGTSVNQFVTQYSKSTLAKRLKPAQSGWNGEACWEFELELAKRLGNKTMYCNPKWFDSDDYNTGWASFIAADTAYTGIVAVEFSNENWQSGSPAFDQGNWLTMDAAAAGISRERLHSRRTRQTVQLWKNAFGVQAHRVRGVLAWQTFTSISAWEDMLNFEDCYQVIGTISTAPYHSTPAMDYDQTSTAIKNAVAANDYPAFVAAMRAYMATAIPIAVSGVKALWDWLPNYCVSKGLPKDAIQIESYEANHHVEVRGSWPNMTRALTFWNDFKSSSDMSDMTALYIDSFAASCPHHIRMFDYSGIAGRTPARRGSDGSGWGVMRKTGNLSDHPMSAIIERAEHYNAL